MSAPQEPGATFDCFGSSCAVHVSGEGWERTAEEAVRLSRRRLLAWHRRFSRFLPDSELSRLNRDPRRQVPASPLMVRLAAAVRRAGALSGGLVDATLIEQIEAAGYREDLGHPLPLSAALALAPPRRAGGARPNPGWRALETDTAAGTISRPPGVKLDSGGLVKGLLADVLGDMLSDHQGFAVNCAGDLLIGGSGQLRRPIHVASPFDGSTLHTFHATHTGVATSGIGRRSWLDVSGAPAHHLLDPATGRPAFTGIVQVTALAPSALLAEIHAKSAILSGPLDAPRWLPHGGVIVLDDGAHLVIEPPAEVSIEQLERFTRSPHSSPARVLAPDAR